MVPPTLTAADAAQVVRVLDFIAQHYGIVLRWEYDNGLEYDRAWKLLGELVTAYPPTSEPVAVERVPGAGDG